MLTAFCKRWLKRRGHTVLEPAFVGMVISGPYVAIQDERGVYTVTPPYPAAYIMVLNHAYANLSAASRDLVGKDVLVETGEYGETTYSAVVH
jgi:hypothetical protein